MWWGTLGASRRPPASPSCFIMWKSANPITHTNTHAHTHLPSRPVSLAGSTVLNQSVAAWLMAVWHAELLSLLSQSCRSGVLVLFPRVQSLLNLSTGHGCPPHRRDVHTEHGLSNYTLNGTLHHKYTLFAMFPKTAITSFLIRVFFLPV